MRMMGTLNCCTAEYIKLSYSEYFNNNLVFIIFDKVEGTCGDSSVLMKYKGTVWGSGISGHFCWEKERTGKFKANILNLKVGFLM